MACLGTPESLVLLLEDGRDEFAFGPPSPCGLPWLPVCSSPGRWLVTCPVGLAYV